MANRLYRQQNKYYKTYIIDKKIKFLPFYKNSRVLDLKTASRLIELILLKQKRTISFIICEYDCGDNPIRILLDGYKSLNMIFAFIANTYPLIGLKNLKNLNGKKYNDLPWQYKRLIYNYRFKFCNAGLLNDGEVINWIKVLNEKN